MKVLDSLKNLFGGEDSTGMDQAMRLATAENKLVLVDIYSPL